MPIDATHLTSLFENATEGIILTNGTGSIVLVNPAAEQIFGYEASELTGNAVEILLPDSMRMHHHSLRNDFYKRGEELFVIAFIVDITQRKKNEENIRRQQQELESMAHRMQRLNTQLETKVEERTLILKEALKKLEESQKDLSDALDKERQLNEI